ncbi:MAG: acyl-CoA dehydrogenase family protein [Ferruginibacter sp.]
MSAGIAINYAKTREQFKTPIANFGAIKYKLAEMAIRIFASESALYRTSKWVDDKEIELAAAGQTF